ncbi:NAD-dependent DNA ligase LigA [Treponema pedis]|uniref:NAD-dependent DNA ligase LigA n=1 Tax=Treponema pedis TaxID=409322 RepID=UPI00198269E6|nr:NAD-dependent DNA ligase LigA [Treponema pedis]QSI05051.1 DNA ligase (NAD(+)) LigA [Treponema pedis]
MENKKRIKELEKLIKKHQDLYYNSEPEISDAEFDELWDELKILDPKNKIFTVVPKESADGFPKAEHIVPMGSQEKAANPEAFSAWALKMPFNEFIVQYKLDGASIELQYEKGKFVRAVTRGDGKIGDDITENAHKMKGVVKILSGLSSPSGENPFTGGIRGEVIMTRSAHKSFFSDKANCRNAANGLMKKKNGEGNEHLTVICYDAVQGTQGKPFSGYAPFKTETEKLAWLKDSGFLTVELKLCKSIDEVIKYRAEVMEKRPLLDFDIDGLVVKNDEIDSSDVSRARPEKQIAFKFSLEEAVTVLRGIEWSESGATYTPIALIEPIRLAGTTVKRASLANPNIIEALNLKIGSRVAVTKRGEIIPKIEALIENPSGVKPIEYPDKCSACGSSLVNEGTRLYCPNISCKKLILHRIEKWISVLDIRDFGITLIRRLFDMERINSIYDLYTLTVEELSAIDRMGKVSAAKVYTALHSKKEISLKQFIAGFDIEGIGEVMVEKLEEAGFDTPEKLFKANENDFAKVYQFGEVLSNILVTSLKLLKEEMQTLIDSGNIKIKEPLSEKDGAVLKGFSFCFTGELNSMKRAEAEIKVKERGGSVKSSVIKGLSYLVTNTPDSGSSKNKKAQELGTAIITEKEFLKMLEV